MRLRACLRYMQSAISALLPLQLISHFPSPSPHLPQTEKDLIEELARLDLRGFYVLEIVLKWIDDNGLDAEPT